MDEWVLVSGAIKAIDGRLLTLEDKASVLASLVKVCGEYNLEFNGKVAYSYEFLQDVAATSGPGE